MSRREGVARSNSCSPAPGVSWKDIPRDISLEELARSLVSRRWRDQHNLRLTAPERKLVAHSVLREQRRWPRPPEDGGGPAVDVFLLDNALLFVKENVRDGVFELYKPPIPLDLLLMPPDTQPETPSKQGTPVTFVHRGRGAGGASFTLFARSAAERSALLDTVTSQQARVWNARATFRLVRVADGFFGQSARCAVPLEGGTRVLVAAADGIYSYGGDVVPGEPARGRPAKVLAVEGVTFIDVSEERRLLFTLSNHCVTAFPLDALSAAEPIVPHRRAQIVSNMASFFQLGTAMGRVVLAVVRSRPLNSHVKLFEVVDPAALQRSHNRKISVSVGPEDPLVESPDMALRPFKRIEHPLEITWIRLGQSKLCVSCARGISVVDIETLVTQDVIDPIYAPATPLAHAGRALAMFRIDDEFLLCYETLAFYINTAGGPPDKQHVVIYWEGEPSAFALRAPYIFAFSSSFVEVRHVSTGELVQTLHGAHMRCLTPAGAASIGDTAPPPYSAAPGLADPVAEEPLLVNANDDVMLLQPIISPPA
ncbi:CNH-domain-containing protein [Auricularia subglabra TFB-10046 SS5]|nr:CNH-domain-containing protein [Auricularia subglabra TFB-10046 SS5]